MLESGPAAGVIGTQALCRASRSTTPSPSTWAVQRQKGCHLQSRPDDEQGAIGGYDRALPVQIAMMDIFEVGTGGGSIARVEQGGLRVGPQSAGAAPGPACYGLGGPSPLSPTPISYSGGSRRPIPRRRDAADVAAAERAMASVAARLGLAVVAAADGILRIAPTAMSYAVKGVRPSAGLMPASSAVCLWRRRALHAVQVRARSGPQSDGADGAACSPGSACCSPTCATTSCVPR